MSALAAALATFSVPAPPSIVDSVPDDHLIIPMPVAGPSRPTLPETPVEIPTVSPDLRANEHLAVLLPRSLWKVSTAPMVLILDTDMALTARFGRLMLRQLLLSCAI